MSSFLNERSGTARAASACTPCHGRHNGAHASLQMSLLNVCWGAEHLEAEQLRGTKAVLFGISEPSDMVRSAFSVSRGDLRNRSRRFVPS